MGSRPRRTIALPILRCCCHAVLVGSVAGGFGTPSSTPFAATRAHRTTTSLATPPRGRRSTTTATTRSFSSPAELRMARKRGVKSPPKSRKIPRRGRGGGGRRSESEARGRRRLSRSSSSSSPRQRRRRKGETATGADDDDDATFSTALAIVPPDRAWDTIQRARHMARDASYHRWPPAIRLFHPFVPRKSLTDAAVDVAALVERREVTPFEVTLDRLLVLPHFEALDERFDALGDEEGEADEEEAEGGVGPDDEVSALIASEERKGKEKLRKRLEAEEQKRREEEGKKGEEPDGKDLPEGRDALDDASERTHEYANGDDGGIVDSGDDDDARERSPSPREVVERQRAMRKRFNGPCVVCLEPDDESKGRIERLRELLRSELFESYDPFSVSSSVSDGDSLPRSGGGATTTSSDGGGVDGGEGGNGSFRPALPIGRFPTVERAVSLARRLQNLWEPLRFNVTDLHLIGRDDGRDRERAAEAAASRFAAAAAAAAAPSSSSSEPMTGVDGGRVDGSVAAAKSAAAPEEDPERNRERWLRNRRRSGKSAKASSSAAGDGSEERSLSSTGRYGCDAMVMLLGEEVASSVAPGGGTEAEEEERLVLDLLMSEAGQEGGGAKSLLLDRDGTGGADNGGGDGGGVEEEDGGDGVDLLEEEWEDFLDDDDDWDEGATIVIGRTHFFLGEMRQYVGMPATSTMDGKDRVLGESVSAVARRKGSVHRQGDRWKEGEFGHKERDYLP